MSSIKSVRNKVNIEYVVESLIQIESELNNNSSKEVIKDFSKLVCGNECLKIMIISKFKNYHEEILKRLFEIAKNTKGVVYLIIIEHPRDWGISTKIHDFLMIYSYDKQLKKFIIEQGNDYK